MTSKKVERKTPPTNSAAGDLDVQALVFDAYGTLFDLNSFAKHADKVHRGRGNEILRIVRQKQIEYAMTRTMLKKYENFELLTRKAIQFALKELRLSSSDESIEKIFSGFLHMNAYKDVADCLSDLDEANMHVAMFSNGTQTMLDKLVEYAGLSLLAEESVSVDGAKTYKPDPKAYSHILTHLEDYEKEKILYVSGNTWDVAGAKSFGFRVGWINRTRQPIFDEALYDLRPDFEFSNLSEIGTLLK